MSAPVRIDPNTRPKAVRDIAAAGEELHRRVYPTTVEPASPAGTEQPSAPQPPAAPDPAAPPAAPPAPAAPAVDMSEPTEEDYRQRFLTLQGKYDAEVPRLRQQVDGLQHVLASLDTTPPQLTPIKPDEGGDYVQKLATIKEEFGDEFVDAIVQEAVSRIQPQIGELQEAASQHNRRLEETRIAAAQDAQAQMYTHLNTQIPNWREINRHPVFHQWLSGIDIFSGAQRQRLLEHAFAANSGPRVAAFFLAFLGEQTATGAPPNTQQPPGLPETPPTPRPSLDTFAAPGRTAAAPPAASATQGRIWTRAEISAFYSAKRRGEYSSADADALERDLIAAGKEGRVRG